ncbi:MAG TPA: hypothetical protein VHR86_02690, partial [Armatimonadota bacterium]|nr:hypothetical protein [Armatimonadota bacterium]
FQVFVDEGGHAYTVAQALQCARWIYRWLRREPEHPLPQIRREDLSLDPPESLCCYPPAAENMFTLNRALSEQLSRERSVDDLPRRVFRATRLDLRRGAVTNAYAETPASVWIHSCQEVCLETEPGIALPATFLYPQDRSRRHPALLYFDDQGRWAQLREHGMLARCARFLEREAEIPAAIFSVDLRGWGDTQPAPVPYDLASWAGKGRLLSYLSAGLNDSLLGMRVRDALAALQYLRQREEVDPEQILVGGRGLGAVVALHVAVLDSGISGVMAATMPSSFALLAQDADYTWPPEAFLTGVLRHYDLPDLVTALAPRPLLLINPLDARQQPLAPEQAETLFPSQEGLVLRAGSSEAESVDTQVEWVRALAGAA